MKLYFLRHGSAEERHEGRRDFDRRLTAEGIAEMKRVAKGLADLEVAVDLIITSPLPRALETAKIAQAALKAPAESLVVSDRVAAGAFEFEELQELVRGLPEDHRVMLVGHEPDFSGIVRDLTGATIELKKAGLALIEAYRIERGSGVLRWLVTPRLLQSAARE